MINSSSLTGRLTKDVELKYTPSGIPVGSFTLAVNRNFTKENGEREADFINCVVWRKTAETMANHLKKGSLIGVTGRLQSRSFEGQHGNMIFVTELVVDNFCFLESKEDSPPKETYRRYEERRDN